jgi:hypothetical protein
MGRPVPAREAARILGVSSRHVARLAGRGELVYEETPLGRLYDRAASAGGHSLRALAARQQAPAACSGGPGSRPGLERPHVRKGQLACPLTRDNLRGLARAKRDAAGAGPEHHPTTIGIDDLRENAHETS